MTTRPDGTGPTFLDSEMTNRLRNTPATLQQLLHNDRAILLRNALVDTANGEPLAIPAALRSQRPAEAYVVQANGPITAEFRDALVRSGASSDCMSQTTLCWFKLQRMWPRSC